MSNQPSAGTDRNPEPAVDPFARSQRDRASLVDRGYFHDDTPLNRRKRRLAWWGLILPLIPIGVAFAWPGGDRIYSRGHVATVHAAWNDRCEVCHEPFLTPINENRWITGLIGGAGEGRPRNKLCEGCHAAPVHRASEKESSVVNCGGCHRDHRGADASLVRLQDSDCTRCHNELAAHTKGGSPEFAVKVMNFATDHPEFRLVDKNHAGHFDPQSRGLKFSHAEHMMPGIDASGDSKRPWTYAQLPNDAERQRYWRIDPQNKNGSTEPKLDAMMQLDCAACHQLDGREAQRVDATQARTVPGAAVAPSRSAGEYMLPVNFETHCKACHPINDFNPNPKYRHIEAPHRVQPADMEPFLRGMVTNQVLGENDELKKLIAKPLDRLDARDRDLGDSMKKEVEKRLESAKNDLFTGERTCAKCHDFVDGDYKKGVRPLGTSAVWFEHAKFDHAAHRAVDCVSCHKGAYEKPPGAGAKPGQSLNEKEPLLIEGIASCRTCHAPASTVDGKPRGGVRSDCTDCHRYHNGDHPTQGIGAGRRDPKSKLTLDQLLGGDLKKEGAK